jgi:ribosomal protein S18 acetylase RimI-like enzyme
VATALLAAAEHAAKAGGFEGLALDTGLHNDAARSLYEALGFSQREVRRAPSPRVAAAIGGPGFVGYVKSL